MLRERLDRPRRFVHVTDREGDCWASLVTAWSDGVALITRVAQHHRAVVEHPKGLRAWLRAHPIVRTLDVTVRTSTGERDASLHLRWAPVTLRPPRRTPRRWRRPLPLCAVWLHESATTAGAVPLDVVLLTTVAVTSDTPAQRIARWYTARWAVEIVFDLIKNACLLEAHAVTDVASFKRLVAVSGPVAVKVAHWIHLARAPRPPPVTAVWDATTLRVLREVCRFHRVPTPTRWSVRSVVAAVAQLGGWEPRRDRKPGWRVVLRGWRRFEDLRRFAEYLASSTHEDRPPRKPSSTHETPRKQGPP